MKTLVTEIFVRRKQFNIQYFTTLHISVLFTVPQNDRLNTTHYFIIKIPNKRETQKMVLNHSSDISLKILRRFTKTYLRKHHTHFNERCNFTIR